MQEGQTTVSQAASSPNNQSPEQQALMMVVDEIKKLRVDVDTLRGRAPTTEQEMEEDWED